MQTCLAASCIEALRIGLLDDCGLPLDGANNGYAIRSGNANGNGIVDFTWDREYEDGEESVVKTHCDDICVRETNCDKLKMINLDLKLCKPDDEFETLVSGNPLIVDTGVSIGYIETDQDDCSPFVSLEVWERIPSAECVDATTPKYRRHIWPKTRLKLLGGNEREGKIRILTLNGHTEPTDIQGYGDGAFNDSAFDFATGPAGTLQYAQYKEDDVPFDGSCGTIAVPVQV